MITVDFDALGFTDRDIATLALHFHDGMTYREIGQIYGVSRQAIHDCVKKCVRKLLDNNIPIPQKLQHIHVKRTPVKERDLIGDGGFRWKRKTDRVA